MKKIFHPLIPLFILLLLAGKYSYDTFFSEKYDEKTLVLLNATEYAGVNTSKNYLDIIGGKMKWNMQEHFSIQGIKKNDKEIVFIQSKLDRLQAIHERYDNQIYANELYGSLNVNRSEEGNRKFLNQNYFIQNLNLQTLFTNYLKEIKAVDSLISDKHKSYIFEENQTDEELENKYLQGRRVELMIHLARFKAELAQIYAQAVDTLVEEYVYFAEADKYKDAIFRPVIEKVLYPSCKDCYHVFEQEITPFTTYRDTTELRSQIETNVNYYFDEKGFFVINEKNFDMKNLKLEWKPFKGQDSENRNKPSMQYREEGLKYEQ